MNWLLIAISLLGVVTDDWTKEKPVSIRKWMLDAEEICAKYGKASTVAETNARIEAMVNEFADKMDGSIIEFKVQIKEVKWKDGFAYVNTLNELPLPKSASPAMPLSITKSEYQFEMQQSEATKIKPGAWLSFKGKLKFFKGKWGNVGISEHAQQMYTLRHKFLGVGFLGTFVTNEYECEIDRKPVKGRWAN